MQLQPDPDRRCYTLAEDCSVTVDDLTIHVPAGFPCDGASIPPLVWPLLYQPFDPRVMVASTIHDWLYHTHCHSRAVADTVLEKLLLRNRAAPFKAWIIYRVVRLIGGLFWPNAVEDHIRLRDLYQRHQHRPDVAKFGFPVEIAP